MDEEIEKFFFLLTTTTTTCSSSSSKTQGSEPIILLSGPPNSGKTSLLFQYAFNSANAANVIHSQTPHSTHLSPQVVFICKRSKLQMKPPFLSQGVHPSSHVFQLIHIKYVEDIEGLVNYFAAFHLYHQYPLTVIVDDFGLYFHDAHDCYGQEKYNNSRGRDFAMVKTLALCCNAIIHANETGHPCKLLLSDTHQGDMPKLLYIYRRWVSSIYNIKGDSGTFLLQRIPSQSPANVDLQKRRIAKYSIALQQLVLEGFSEDMDQ
ncbi:putative P-loop containing nucleoside triphosphate hydrolase [Heracleum sosnowskyi]|uniref:P-loop containing nucleoside triphosphate hydrolase n=1 Tax=Heracleum sosnowskyi TaxID=360622 RepID=A0AAD8MAG4_9APIA|nr:putative P-loop containing nucleoside triphosphate hydrolase [Heracleum sosnowskyi]